jgi:hypothetical protein
MSFPPCTFILCEEQAVIGSYTVGGFKRLESVYYGSMAADKDDVNLVQS